MTHTAIDLDHHLIIGRAQDGTLYTAETEFPLTLKQAAELIRSGQVERADSVLFFNVAEKTIRNVSEDAALEVAALARDEGLLPRLALEFIDSIDEEVGNEVRWLECA